MSVGSVGAIDSNLSRRGASVRTVIAANAGWYCLPYWKSKFPYGLVNSPVSRDGLKKSFDRRLLIFLGESDTDMNDTTLRQTPDAMKQGKNRLPKCGDLK